MIRVTCVLCLVALLVSCSSKNNPAGVQEKPAPTDSTATTDSTVKKDSLTSHPPKVTTWDTTSYRKISISITGLEFEWAYSGYDHGLLTPIEHRRDTSYNYVGRSDFVYSDVSHSVTRGDTLQFSYGYDMQNHTVVQVIRTDSSFLRIQRSSVQGTSQAGRDGNGNTDDFTVSHLPFTVLPDHSLQAKINLHDMPIWAINTFEIGDKTSSWDRFGHGVDNGSSASTRRLTGVANDASLTITISP